VAAICEQVGAALPTRLLAGGAGGHAVGVAADLCWAALLAAAPAIPDAIAQVDAGTAAIGEALLAGQLTQAPGADVPRIAGLVAAPAVPAIRVGVDAHSVAGFEAIGAAPDAVAVVAELPRAARVAAPAAVAPVGGDIATGAPAVDEALLAGEVADAQIADLTTLAGAPAPAAVGPVRADVGAAAIAILQAVGARQGAEPVGADSVDAALGPALAAVPRVGVEGHAALVALCGPIGAGIGARGLRAYLTLGARLAAATAMLPGDRGVDADRATRDLQGGALLHAGPVHAAAPRRALDVAGAAVPGIGERVDAGPAAFHGAVRALEGRWWRWRRILALALGADGILALALDGRPGWRGSSEVGAALLIGGASREPQQGEG